MILKQGETIMDRVRQLNGTVPKSGYDSFGGTGYGGGLLPEAETSFDADEHRVELDAGGYHKQVTAYLDAMGVASVTEAEPVTPAFTEVAVPPISLRNAARPVGAVALK